MPSVEGVRRAPRGAADARCRASPRPDARRGRASRSRGLSPPDHALAVAIAGETLRRLPDLDALIDSATRQRLPDDSQGAHGASARARPEDRAWHARPCAGRDRAAVGRRRAAAAGPWRSRDLAAHAACRRSMRRIFPQAVEERWRTAWGEDGRRGRAARRSPSVRRSTSPSPTIRRPRLCRAHGGISLAPRHVRVDSSSVTELPGFGDGRWWVQDLAASLPARLIPAKRERRARPVRRARAARRCSSPRPAMPSRRSTRRKAASRGCAKISTARISMPSWSQPMR